MSNDTRGPSETHMILSLRRNSAEMLGQLKKKTIPEYFQSDPRVPSKWHQGTLKVTLGYRQSDPKWPSKWTSTTFKVIPEYSKNYPQGSPRGTPGFNPKNTQVTLKVTSTLPKAVPSIPPYWFQGTFKMSLVHFQCVSWSTFKVVPEYSQSHP